MDILSRQHLEFLSAAEHRFCISLFMPTHRAGKEVLQDSIRLKNLLKCAEDELVKNGVPKLKARELLAPAQQLQARGGFWRRQSDGLAMFLAPGFSQYFRLPLEFKELVTVGERFQIQPLLPLFTAGGRFCLLALSQKNVRLFEGTDYVLSELNLDGVPRNIREILKYEVHEGMYNVHSGTGAPAGEKKEGGVFHGQGAGVDDAKEKILLYCQQVDKGLHRVLRGQTAPLLVAAVTDLFAIYRQANTYSKLLEKSIEGNPDGLGPEELHRAAGEILRPYFSLARDQALTLYTELAGSVRASNELHETLRAAYQGRIQFLILPPGVERWGRYDFEKDEFLGHDERQPGDENLLNLIAVQTVLHAGALYAVAPEQMPGYSLVAAVFRY